ncbi:MAG TPA: hypothetical protein VNW46_15660 [Gemmatimonadaceae bacterium]|jgi:hypothetical protein|nr:hypothetical protein [Gemmatimonadaceae bacterium]
MAYAGCGERADWCVLADGTPVPWTRRTYEARIIISGLDNDAGRAAAGLRAWMRRYHKPSGCTMRVADANKYHMPDARV